MKSCKQLMNQEKQSLGSFLRGSQMEMLYFILFLIGIFAFANFMVNWLDD